MSSPSIYNLPTMLSHLNAFGDVAIPGSKSSTLRALLLSALSRHPTQIHNVLRSEDTDVMLRSLIQLGASVRFLDETTVTIAGPLSAVHHKSELHLGESGLSLRLLLVYLGFFSQGPISLRGDGRLLKRPLEGLLDIMRKLGVVIDVLSDSINIIPHPLPKTPIEISIDPSVSSQWVSALAIALAHHPYGGILCFTRPAVSRSYLDLTSHWLNVFGCQQRIESKGWKIPGGVQSPETIFIEGDWSSAAVFILASATQGIPLCLKGLQPTPIQGDQELLEILLRSSVTHHWRDGDIHIQGKIARGIQADLSSCPDLAPVLAAACVLGSEPSYLTGLQTLRDKESDRFKKIQDLILWIGGTYDTPNTSTLTIYPRTSHHRPQGVFDPAQDHRMAFAAALGTLATGGSLRDPSCVHKTLPQFWDLWLHMLSGT